MRELEQVHVLLGFNGLSYDDKDYYALQILSVLLGGGMSSRLFQKVREELGLAYSIYSFSSSYVDGGFFGKGIGEGTLNSKIPEAHTDFIVSVISEEIGIIIIHVIMLSFIFFAYTIFKKIIHDNK